MIATLTGTLAAKSAGACVLEVGGVGFRVSMSALSLAALPSLGDEVRIHTHLHVREDELSLFGFESEAERSAFELLLTVSGIGPKVALAALSTLSPEALARAVATEDIALIASVPGLGKKTAQRIVVDLADKFGSLPLSSGDARSVAKADGAVLAQATEALLAMGFTSVEASAALAGYDGPADSAQAALRHALTRLGSR